MVVHALILAASAQLGGAQLNGSGRLPVDLPKPKNCQDCAEWNRPHAPVHVFGNTWWVGVDGLSVVAIDTGAGVILLDGALPQSVPLIKQSLTAAGLRLSEVKFVGTSHAHFDHVGGISELQGESRATVLASDRTSEALRSGCPNADDPQAGFGCEANGFPPVMGRIRAIRDGEVIKLGNVELSAHLTPGHTPGSTTWTWKSCEAKRCLDIVYADSLNPVSVDGFQFKPIASTFKASIAKVGSLPCDVLLSAHPDASNTVERLSHRLVDGGAPDPVQAGQCEAYAAQARAKLEARLESEAKAAAH
jgi:metallo-beta-lactamase class B